MMGWNQGWSTGDWVAMFLMMAVFWGALIAVVVWAVRSLRPDRTDPPSRPTAQQTSEPGGRAEQILDERFARGELTAEEFTRSRDLLRSKPGDTPEVR
jgi:putative membrane protein